MKDETTCGIVVWSRRERRIKTCGAKAVYDLLFHEDMLFAVCERHDKRLRKAFPDMAVER